MFPFISIVCDCFPQQTRKIFATLIMPSGKDIFRYENLCGCIVLYCIVFKLNRQSKYRKYTRTSPKTLGWDTEKPEDYLVKVSFNVAKNILVAITAK